MAEGQDRLAAALARKAAAEAKRPTIDEEAAAIAAAEREADEAEAITRACCELGEQGRYFEVVTTDLGAIIVRRPEPVRYRRFQELEAPRVEDIERLVKPAVYWPARTQLDTMLDEQPGILMRIAAAVGKLAGVRRDELAPNS